jgi:hypothetical protein
MNLPPIGGDATFPGAGTGTPSPVDAQQMSQFQQLMQAPGADDETGDDDGEDS